MDVNQLKSRIDEVLPRLEAGKSESLALSLHSKGLRSENRLHLVTVEDLTELDLFDARELVEAWRAPKEQENKGQDNQGRQPLSERQFPNQHPGRRSEKEWDFQIDWADIYKISPNIRQKMINGKKLKKKEKRELVKRLVSQVTTKVPNVCRGTFKQVAGDLRQKYPVTFVSELAKGKLNRNTICFKMQTKFDNDFQRHKNRNFLETKAPAIKAAYGCEKWRVTKHPPGETAETQERHRVQLQSHYEDTRPNAWDLETVKEKMALTYGTLRKEINKQAEEILRASRKKRKGGEPAENIDDPITVTEELRNRWPFLFLPDGMLTHFKTLTGVNFQEKLQEFYINDMENLLEFLLETSKRKDKKKTQKRMKAAEEKAPNGSRIPKLLAVLHLILQRFEESDKELWQILDSHVREDDIPHQCQLPKTPSLVIAGGKNIFDVFSNQHIYFCMDSTVLGTADNVEEGICMVFCAYFNFNLEYAANAQITLEFIQRVIAEICPPKGNKRPPKSAGGKSSTRVVHDKLRSLNDKYDAFFAEKDDSESTDENEEN